jgi:TctA family transporter
MLSIFGLSLVAVLSRGAPVKGILSGLVGVLLATVGLAPATTDMRFTFENIYLMSGIDLVVVALALFAIPEIVELVSEGKAISRKPAKLSGSMVQGLKDTLGQKRLVLQGSVIGTVLGILPGVGGAALTWIAYGVAKATTRNDNRFGKGDVRGVIAPEAANNANEGGSLIPTLLFGIPGGGTAAILLGGLVLLGINPGPDMVEPQNLPVLLTIVWTLAIANVLGTGMCILLARPVSMLTQVPASLLAPFLFVIIILASYQATNQWGDIILVLALGLVAVIMKRLDWPRVPMLIGFVLGPGAERYFTVSTSRFGAEWLTNPGVIVIAVLIVGAVALGLRSNRDLADVATDKALDVEVATDERSR